MSTTKIPVSALALRELLSALTGPGHLIRELQMLRGPLVGEDNPINILIAEFNAAVELQPHTDEIAVDRFAEAMKLKLASSRAKGRSGWDDPERCSVTLLSELLRGHVEKGDPVDVANFCMMLNERGAGIVQPPPALKCGLCGYSGTETDHIGQCPKCHWDELQPVDIQSGERESLRQRLGEALSEVLTDPDAAPEPDWNDAREIDRVISVILPFVDPTQHGNDLLSAAKRLQARGFFTKSTCADADTNLEMKVMCEAIARAESAHQ